MPGMTCKVKLTPYLKQDALTVPPTAVVTDELDEEKQTVQVLEKDGTTKSRPVTVGRKTDKQVEILKGLSEGDKVVIEPKKQGERRIGRPGTGLGRVDVQTSFRYPLAT